MESCERLYSALESAIHPVVIVSNEVGLGVVPGHPSGRLFRDLIGRANAETASRCDHVHLVCAGRVIDLGKHPRVEEASTQLFDSGTVGSHPLS